MLSPERIDEIKSQAFLGRASSLENGIKIYPLSISEILDMGIIQYNSYIGLLLLTQQDIQNKIKEKTNKIIPLEEIDILSYLVASADMNDNFLLDLKSAFSTFCQRDVLIIPELESIAVGEIKEHLLIDKNNFSDFQDILRIQNQKEVKEEAPKNESPAEKKMRELRERVEAVKRKQAQKEGVESQNFSELLEIASVYGIDIEKCTLYSLYNKIQRHRAREKWEQDFAMLCAGADPKQVDAKYWGETLKI